MIGDVSPSKKACHWGSSSHFYGPTEKPHLKPLSQQPISHMHHKSIIQQSICWLHTTKCHVTESFVMAKEIADISIIFHGYRLPMAIYDLFGICM